MHFLCQAGRQGRATLPKLFLIILEKADREVILGAIY